uniref:Integrase catalytic domain-containing protein n=1 Tax=Trichogramma kaykai TaxID=54128 RepID=A0ABD2WZU4_9HYME
MSSILSKGRRVPKHLHTDRGKEFYNKDFEAVMNKYNINLYSTYSNLKASIVERFNRTLKNIMWKQFSLQGNHKWTNIVSKLTSDYNELKHRTIGMAPARVTQKNEKDILKMKFVQRVGSVSRKFKIGDKVRVSKAKHLFEKGYEPNWTTEIFTVRRVAPTDPELTTCRTTSSSRSPDVFTKKNFQKQSMRTFTSWKKLSRDVEIRLMLNG